jgi:PAS domain S-box-containing protein
MSNPGGIGQRPAAPSHRAGPKASATRESRLTSVLRAIRNVNQLIIHEEDPHRLIERACETLTETLGYHNAWIALFDGDGRTVAATASAGDDSPFEPMHGRLVHGEYPACMQQAVKTGATVVVYDPSAECADCPLAREYHERARFTRRLAFEGKTYDILAVSVPAAHAHDSEERSLFDEVAGDLGFALHKIELQTRLREADSRVRAKLNALLAPEGDAGELSLADVLDVPAIQGMMDNFLNLTGIGGAIVDVHGKILVATGWQDICTKFHRAHPDTCRHCIESDTTLSSGVEPGAFKFYRCKNNLWDVATPIMLGNRHAGNVFFGQFFFDDETPDRECFRNQARRCAFDEVAYLAAMDRVPRVSRDRVHQIMTFYADLARQLSDLSYGNIRLARTLVQRDELLRRLGQNEERLRLALKATNDVVWDWDIVNDSQRWNESGAAVFGWTDIVEAPQTSAWWVDRVHPEDRPRVDQLFFAAVRDLTLDRWSDEYRFRKADGDYAYVVDRGYIVRDADGQAVRIIGAMQDIAERKRAETELVFQAHLLRNIRDLVVATDLEGRITYISDSNCAMQGRSRDELMGSHVGALGENPARGASQVEIVRRTREDGQWRGKVVNMAADGRAFLLDCRTWLIRDTNGTPCGMVGISTDITERDKAERTLKESEARFAALFHSSPMAAAITAVEDGRLVDLNTEFERVSGHTRADCLGRPVLELGLWVNPDERAELVRKVNEEGAARGFECRLRNASGQILPILMSAEIVRIGDANFMLTMALDISQRKQAEAALKASEMRFKQLLQNVPTVAVQGYALDGSVRYWNRASETFYGYTAQEALSKNLLDLIIPPAMRDAVRSEIRQMVESGETIPTAEVQLMRKDRSRIPVYSSHTLVQLPGHEPELFCIDIDLSELKRTQAEQERLQAQFLQAQKMESVGRLAGGVAHDFNNLLMGIMGYTDLCRELVAEGHPARRWLDEILLEAQRSANLVRQLLTFARKQIVQPIALDLNEQVGGILTLLGRLIGEHIELTWSPATNLRIINADPSHIDQVMANLCVNAADAITDHGCIALATHNVAIEESTCTGLPGMRPGNYVLLTVADTGCGMDADTLTHAFEPFFTTKDVGRGTGLGLATVYGIVKQSGGFIYVNSTAGAGTTFSIYLPAVDHPETVALPLADAGPPPGGNETVLVVDDEKSIRVTTAVHLERLGYTVLLADGPEAALQMARAHANTIDLLLSDVVMPGMSGIELRDRLLPERPTLKTIFMTGYTTTELTDPTGKGVEAVHLTKPISLQNLATAIRSVLGNR